MSNRVVVMYAGEVVETGSVRDVLKAPEHPYTRLLLAAMPTARKRDAHLPFIPGTMPAPGNLPYGCRFHPRCPDVQPGCSQAEPALIESANGRSIRCPVSAGLAEAAR
jgi:oligopeptide/dipeptide ABC transporter ATP-binding protein